VNSFRRSQRQSPCKGLLIAFALALAAGGCRREEIQVYRIPKETAATPAAPMTASGADMGMGMGAEKPSLTWTLPSGWQQRPAEQMRLASFSAVTKDGREADVAVIALPGMEGKDGQIINMWREQVKLPPGDDAALAAKWEKVSIGSKEGKLFEVIGTEPVIDNKFPEHILVAVLSEGGVNWYFKMAGPDQTVRDERPAFLEFLKSVAFVNGGMTMAANPGRMSTNAKETPTQDEPLPDWQPPADWQPLATPPMLRAKFLVPGAGDTRAEINISASSGMGGGALANVVRWRGQLGLEPVDQAGLDQLATTVDTPGGKALIVDMSGTDKRTGQPARLVAAIVPAGSETWFYKLMGTGSVVEKEKAAFLQFVQTARYPHGS